MPIPIEDDYQPHGAEIAERVALFKSQELINWFESMSVIEQETAYNLYTYPMPQKGEEE